MKEESIPVHPEVNAACEMLGSRCSGVANEGKLVAIVPEGRGAEGFGGDETTEVWRRCGGHRVKWSRSQKSRVVEDCIGHRVVDMLAGEMLPEFVEPKRAGCMKL